MKRNIIGRPKPVETQIYYVERIISIYQVMDSQLIIKFLGNVFTLVIIFPIFALPTLFSRFVNKSGKVFMTDLKVKFAFRAIYSVQAQTVNIFSRLSTFETACLPIQTSRLPLET